MLLVAATFSSTSRGSERLSSETSISVSPSPRLQTPPEGAKKDPDPLAIVRDACVAQPEPPGLLCSIEGIRDMGLALLDALEAQEKAELKLRIQTEKNSVDQGVQAYRLDAWHRKWWLVLPLGVLAGVAATTTLLLLERN